MIQHKRVLILCFDNCTLSPLLHAVLRQYHSLEVLSAGFCEDAVGMPPSPLLIHAARELGLDADRLERHRSTYLTSSMIEGVDAFILFDRDGGDFLTEFCSAVKLPRISPKRRHFFGEYCNPVIEDVPDPVILLAAGDEEDYEEVIDQVIIGGHRLARFLTQPNTSKR